MNDASTAPSPLKVGVSILVRKSEGSQWENTVAQSCLFLVLLLLRSPRVQTVVLVAGVEAGETADVARFLPDSPVPVIDMTTAGQTLDVMIELGAQLGRDWSVAFHESGGKIVSMRVSNDYATDIERMIFGKPHGMLVSGAPYDAIWTLPAYEHACARYLAAAFHVPVRILPPLWSPVLVQRGMARAAVDRPFDYQPGRKRWRVGIFEPNASMARTSFIPMLSCEAAHRSQPECLEEIRVFNSLHLKDTPQFVNFARSMDIVRDSLVTFEAGLSSVQAMPGKIEAVFAHLMDSAPNHLCYEALYGGYPVIHNAPLMADCGWWYSDFDCEQGGLALRRAFAEHDAGLARYRERTGELLARLDPAGVHNVRAYTDAIDQLYE